jgi:hypothetical protein
MRRFGLGLVMGAFAFFALGGISSALPIYCFPAAIYDANPTDETGSTVVLLREGFPRLFADRSDAFRDCGAEDPGLDVDPVTGSSDEALKDLLHERSGLGPAIDPGGSARGSRVHGHESKAVGREKSERLPSIKGGKSKPHGSSESRDARPPAVKKKRAGEGKPSP